MKRRSFAKKGEKFKTSGPHRARKRKWYRANRAHAIATERARYAAKRIRVSDAELIRLTEPTNLLESLSYSEGNHVVCLECGQKLQQMDRHLQVHAMTAFAYKEKWGFNRTTALRTQALTDRHSRVRIERGRRPAVDPATVRAAAMAAASRVRTKGYARLQQRMKRSARRGSRPAMQKIPDSTINRIMGLGISLADGAKLAGLSQTAYYRRIQRLGWTSAAAREKRRLFHLYVFKLRSWLRTLQVLPDVNGIEAWHLNEVRTSPSETNDVIRRFSPYLDTLRTELDAQPELISAIATRRDSAAVITLAARMTKRENANRVTRLPKLLKRPGRQKGRLLGSTVTKIETLAKGILKGTSLYQLSPMIYPGIPRQTAYDRTRYFRLRYRALIDRKVAQLRRSSI